MLLNVIHININVTDLDRSLEFYEKVGFKVMHTFTNEETAGRSRGAVISISDDPRASTKIELIQSLDPPTAPHPTKPLHGAGVSRLAIRTKNLLDHYEKLRSKGIEFLSEPIEIDIIGAKRYVLFRDPDDVVIELIEF
jgi:glyoxylase I family protein